MKVMNEELSGYLGQIEVGKREGKSILAGATDVQFNWRPGPERWSMAQCFDHLNVAMRRTFPAFDRAIADARDRGLRAPGPFRYGWFSRWMVGSMEPPVKRRQRTFKIFVPAEETPLAAALAEFRTVRDQMADRVRTADALDLNPHRVISPVTPFLRLPLRPSFPL